MEAPLAWEASKKEMFAFARGRLRARGRFRSYVIEPWLVHALGLGPILAIAAPWTLGRWAAYAWPSLLTLVGLYVACIAWAVPASAVRAWTTRPASLYWDEAGIWFQEAGVHLWLPWGQVGSVEVDRAAVVFLWGEGDLAFWVPRRAADAHVDAWRRLLRAGAGTGPPPSFPSVHGGAVRCTIRDSDIAAAEGVRFIPLRRHRALTGRFQPPRATSARGQVVFTTGVGLLVATAGAALVSWGSYVLGATACAVGLLLAGTAIMYTRRARPPPPGAPLRRLSVAWDDHGIYRVSDRLASWIPWASIDAAHAFGDTLLLVTAWDANGDPQHAVPLPLPDFTGAQLADIRRHVGADGATEARISSTSASS